MDPKLCGKLSFCGCEQYQYMQSVNQEADISFKVYFCVALIFLIIVISLRLGTGWFIFKDYYPLKQRSPILSILLLTFISLQMMHYPVMFVYNYFTFEFNDDTLKEGYRIWFYALSGASYLIYMLRSARIAYAHQTDPSRNKTWIFKIFKNEALLASMVVGLVMIRSIPVGITFLMNEEKNQFYTAAEFITIYTNNEQQDFLMGHILFQFIWQSILIYCFWLQFYVNKKYSMKNQLLVIIVTGMVLDITGIAYLLIYSQKQAAYSALADMCSQFSFYPIVEIYEFISLCTMLITSIFLPLTKKKVYHTLLPTGRHYGLVKTMRDFLIEEEFREIFTNFLQYKDQQQQIPKYMNLLTFWKKLIILKNAGVQSDLKKIRDIREILDNIEQTMLSVNENLINSLKGSIASLEDSLINQSNEIDENKFKDSINQKVDELENLALTKLDKIYKEQFRITKAYFELKEKIKEYKKINVNMILLNMAIMTDSVEDDI